MRLLKCSLALAVATAGFSVVAAQAVADHRSTAVATAGGLAAPSFTTAQAQRGATLYSANCAECHGANLDDGQFATALKGPAFVALWGGKGLDAPFEFMSTQMPPTSPGVLGAQGYADVLAYILSANGIAPGDKELPADSPALKGLAAPH